MYKLGLLTTHIRSPEFMGSERIDQASWLLLISYCAEHENGGRMDGCRKWKSNVWLLTVGVPFDEIDHDCDLWKWEGDDLIVHLYSLETEEKTKALRERGSRGGKKSGEVRRKSSQTDDLSAAQRSSDQIRTEQTYGQPNGQPYGSSSPTAPSGGGGQDDFSLSQEQVPVLCKFPAINADGTDAIDSLSYEEIESVQSQYPHLNVLEIAMDFISEVKQGKTERSMLGCFEQHLERLCRCPLEVPS